MSENDGFGDIFDDEVDDDATDKVTAEDAASDKAASDETPSPATSGDTSGGKKRRPGHIRNISREGIKASLSPDKAEAVAEKYTRPAWNILSSRGYTQPDIPEGTQGIIYAVDDDGEIELDSQGNEVILYVPPKMISNWRCEYYLQPWRKARLARHVVIAVLLFLVTLSSVVTAVIIPYTSILATIFSFLLIINLSFRYGGIAVYKWPMPPIPFLSNIRFPTSKFVKSYEEALAEAEAEGTTYIAPVNRYAGDTPSPATILTRWMNGIAHWSAGDLSENSGGILDSFRVKSLMNDDKTVWTDEETLLTLGKVTGSSPEQWESAWDAYEAALEEEKGNE